MYVLYMWIQLFGTIVQYNYFANFHMGWNGFGKSSHAADSVF